MYFLSKLITAIILPPFCVLILWLFSLFFRTLKLKYISYFCTSLGIIILYIFSIPYTAQKLHDSLVIENKLTIEDYKKAQAIVILGGGLRDSGELYSSITVSQIPLERLRYSAFLYKQTSLPILITGASPNGNSEAKIMSKELIDFFSIPTRWLENKAQTTIQNAKFTQEILYKENINTIILVTNQWHMQRAKLLFEKQGIIVLPASVGCGRIPNNYKLTLMHFIPQASAMTASVQAIKEWLGYWKEKYLYHLFPSS
ncbi:YdcF family protein [Seminibacterium arietis]|uniref:YdcF family protein n=1 Tax=Seminibacterium arietis TaxID=1173502 RepID=A0ABW3I7R6_9PAST